MEKLTIQIIVGSTREGRLGDKVGEYVKSVVESRTDINWEYIDLKDWQLPFFDEPISPAMNPNPGDYKLDLAKKWAAKVNEADAYLMIVPEYNHSFPAVLKNALDYVYREWNNKPVGFVGYSGGASGGIRAIEQLRQVVGELQMVDIREAALVPFVWKAFDEQGKAVDSSVERMINTTTDQLIDWAKTLKHKRG